MSINYESLGRAFLTDLGSIAHIHIITKFYSTIAPSGKIIKVALAIHREPDLLFYLMAEKSYPKIADAVTKTPFPSTEYDFEVQNNKGLGLVISHTKKDQKYQVTDVANYMGTTNDWIKTFCKMYDFELDENELNEEIKYGATCKQCNELYEYAEYRENFICYPCRAFF